MKFDFVITTSIVHCVLMVDRHLFKKTKETFFGHRIDIYQHQFFDL